MTFCSMLMLLYTNAQFFFFFSFLFFFFDACLDIILWAAPVIISSFMRRFSSVFPGQKRGYLESGFCFNGRKKREYKRESTKDVRGNNI